MPDDDPFKDDPESTIRPPTTAPPTMTPPGDGPKSGQKLPERPSIEELVPAPEQAALEPLTLESLPADSERLSLSPALDNPALSIDIADPAPDMIAEPRRLPQQTPLPQMSAPQVTAPSALLQKQWDGGDRVNPLRSSSAATREARVVPTASFSTASRPTAASRAGSAADNLSWRRNPLRAE